MHCFLLKRPYAPSPDIGRTTHPAVAPQAWPRQSSKRVRILVSLEPKTRQHARRSGADAGDARAGAEPSPRGATTRRPGRGVPILVAHSSRRSSAAGKECPDGCFSSGQTRPLRSACTRERAKCAERAHVCVTGCPAPQSRTSREIFRKRKTSRNVCQRRVHSSFPACTFFVPTLLSGRCTDGPNKPRIFRPHICPGRLLTALCTLP